ncbi:hypothetical protein ACFXPA_09670 [Amycolatopsis sp. NPDC059090]|uniref:hypothetical protein n=1 Tax=unclassified Amycolatopsis TaxID=2618356 RepID=UPI00366DD782
MNTLHTVAALQARVWEFLEQQDEQTLLAITEGQARLAVLHRDGESPEPQPHTTVSRSPAISTDPLNIARELAMLATEEERRTFLNSTRLPVTDLRQVAKIAGRKRYSKLNHADLVTLLAGDSPHPPPARAPGPAAEAEPAPSNAKAAAIANHLRHTETEEEGADYLREQGLSREDLLAVAADLQLTRVSRLSQTELVRRVLKQAIGARRKFAGLRKW